MAQAEEERERPIRQVRKAEHEIQMRREAVAFLRGLAGADPQQQSPAGEELTETVINRALVAAVFPTARAHSKEDQQALHKHVARLGRIPFRGPTQGRMKREEFEQIQQQAAASLE